MKCYSINQIKLSVYGLLIFHFLVEEGRRKAEGHSIRFNISILLGQCVGHSARGYGYTNRYLFKTIQ